MEKKVYISPSLKVRRLQPMRMVAASTLSNIGGNTTLEYGGGSAEAAMGTGRRSIWDNMDE